MQRPLNLDTSAIIRPEAWIAQVLCWMLIWEKGTIGYLDERRYVFLLGHLQLQSGCRGHHEIARRGLPCDHVRIATRCARSSASTDGQVNQQLTGRAEAAGPPAQRVEGAERRWRTFFPGNIIIFR